MLENSFTHLRNAFDSIHPLTDDAWQDLISCFSPLSLQPGEFLLRTGQRAQVFAFNLSGILREFFTTDDGKEFNKSFVAPGMLTGSLMDLLSNRESTASIQALTPVELLLASYEECMALGARHVCIERFLRHFAEHLYVRKAYREYELMCLDATQRYINLITSQPDLEHQVAQYHIAGYLGITPVSLSRIRKSLAAQKRPS